MCIRDRSHIERLRRAFARDAQHDLGAGGTTQGRGGIGIRRRQQLAVDGDDLVAAAQAGAIGGTVVQRRNHPQPAFR